jgi:hypothetical protein
MLKNIGYEKTKLYLNSCLEAIEEYKNLSNELDFDFEDVSSYKYYINDEISFENEIKALKSLEYNFNVVSKVSLPINFDKAIEFKNQGQMNPMLLISELAKKIKIYENTKIIKVKEGIAYTEKYKINAKSIVIATGFPFLKFKGLYSLKMYQNKSYVITTENKYNFKGNMIGSNNSDLYFRDYKGSLIVGGNDIKTGKFNEGFNTLLSFINNNEFKKVNYEWINQDCITLDNIPYIGRISSMSDDIYVSTGFNLWGMTSAMTAAKLISDLICKKTNKYEILFNPSRMYKLKPLFGNISTSIINLLKINKTRCNHLGCSLVKDKENECYECPCHGSKFRTNGDLIDGPAINNLDQTKLK